jgi:dTDP-4-amino-4,6-dideoxygalactose transaminase
MLKFLRHQPLLSSSKNFTYFLRQIDKNRYYSNFGPLYYQCKFRLEKYLNLKKNNIILTSSGHASLLACCYLIKKKNPKKKYILVPSYSFQSNPQSILQAGFEPIFVDINVDNLCFDDKQISLAFEKYKKSIAAIMFVSPFGFPIDINYLNNIQKKFGVFVIYDAADTFINFDKKKLDNSKIFITCSFHPTKTLPSNESGMIIMQKRYLHYFNSIINFGLSGLESKETKNLGFNGKFSEYDAAILMSNFNHIYRIKKILKIKINYVVDKLKSNKFIKFQDLFGKKWFSLKLLIITNKEFNFKSLYEKFKLIYKIHIYKPWSYFPMHKHIFFSRFKRLSLKNTNRIEKRIFCLPFSIDYKKKDLDRLINLINKNFYK